MPFAGYKNFDECVSANSDKKDASAYCSVIMRSVEKGKGKKNKARANAVLGGIELKPVSGKDLPDLTVLAGVETGELMEFKGAILARAEVNRNQDELAPQHIDQLADTLKGMAVTDDHADRGIVGYITAAHSRAKSTESRIDGVIFARRFPEIAAGIQDGTLKLSVEADAPTAACSKCGKVFANHREYCDHIKDVPNRLSFGAHRQFPDGIKGVGAGVVRNPAGSDVGFDTNRLTMIAGAEDMDTSYGMMADPDDVHLRSATDIDERCGTCEYYKSFTKSCSIVQGFIDPGQVCDLWEPGGQTMASLEELKASLDALIKAEEAKKEKDEVQDKDMKDMKAALEKLLEGGHVGEGLPGNPKPQVTEIPTASEPPTGEKKEEGAGTGNPDGFSAAQVSAGLSRVLKVGAVLGAELAGEYAAEIVALTDKEFELLGKVLAAKAEGIRSTNSLAAAFERESSQRVVSQDNGFGMYQPFNGRRGGKE